MGFSRQEKCSGLLFPSPGDLPGPGIKPEFPALQADILPSEPKVLGLLISWGVLPMRCRDPCEVLGPPVR